MRNSILSMFFLLLINTSLVFSQHYKPVDQNSIIQFKVAHQLIFKSTVTGTFQGLKGEIVFDSKNIEEASFNVSIDVKTLNTGIGMRDKDLKKEKYFNEEKYPVIIIKSQNIKRINNNEYIAAATLTLKGITKNISIPFAAILKDGSYQFKGNFKINRLDFDLGPDNSIDKEVDINLLVSVKQ